MYQVFGTVCRVFYTEYCGGNHRCKLGTSLFSKPHLISGRYYEKVFALCDYRKVDFELNKLIPCSGDITEAESPEGCPYYDFCYLPVLSHDTGGVVQYSYGNENKRHQHGLL